MAEGIRLAIYTFLHFGWKQGIAQLVHVTELACNFFTIF